MNSSKCYGKNLLTALTMFACKSLEEPCSIVNAAAFTPGSCGFDFSIQSDILSIEEELAS